MVLSEPQHTSHCLTPLFLAGIPENCQPAARHHRPGEAQPGEKSLEGCSVSTGQEDPTATRAGTQPQPGAVSPLLMPLAGAGPH